MSASSPPDTPLTTGWMWLGFEPLVPGRLKKSPLTLSLVGLTAVFAVSAGTGDTSDIAHLLDLGTLDREPYWKGDWWRLIISGLLHYGFAHFFWNTVSLPGWGAPTSRWGRARRAACTA